LIIKFTPNTAPHEIGRTLIGVKGRIDLQFINIAPFGVLFEKFPIRCDTDDLRTDLLFPVPLSCSKSDLLVKESLERILTSKAAELYGESCILGLIDC
jgi:hypothetical protein